MATYYWVGGSGNWNATSTTNWSNASGGSSGFGPPTSADDVIFDAGSNVGTGAFTVTVTGTSAAPAVCRDFSTGGAGGALDGAMTLTMGATAQLDCYGSMTLPATNLTWTGTSGAILNFKATTTGKTITTNGVTITSTQTVFDGVGGGWTLGSAFTSTTNAVTVINGSFSTGNFNLTIVQLGVSGTATKSISLGSSTVTISQATPIQFTVTTGLTFNAGTSTITCSNASPTFAGGGQTFYNVTFSSAADGSGAITGANTFNNLTFTSRNATGRRGLSINANQTVNGTLTFGTANTAIRRMQVFTGTTGSQSTITLNGTLATLADVDFRDIATAGTAGTWTGTRLGNAGNVSGITTDLPKTVYWNLAGTQNWSATGWATTNNGSPNVNNFPLAQDTAVFTEAGSAGTVTVDAAWWIGSIQMADGVSNRTTAFTLATGTQIPSVFGNVTLFSNLTLSGTGNISFRGQGTTQTITSAGINFTQPLTVDLPAGTFKLSDNLTQTGTVFTLTQGTLDLNNNTLTCVTFSSSNSNTRAIAFGTGQITVTGNNANVFTTSISTGFTVSGTPVVNATYSGSIGTRAIAFGAAGEANAISLNVSAGTDTVSLNVTNGAYKNISFSGFSGTATLINSISCFGNLTLSTGMTVGSGTLTFSFAATSGTQTVTSNGKTFDYPMNINAPGATVQLQDNLTIGSTRTFTLTAGTLNLNVNKILSCGSFATSNSNTRSINFGTSGKISVNASSTTAFNATNSTNLSVTGTGSISMDSASAKTFVGGGYQGYPVLNQGGAGTLTITGSNGFTSITNTVQPATINFAANTTTTVTTLGIVGTAGNLVQLYSSTPGTQYTISDSSGITVVSYADIKDSNATGGAIFLASNSTNSGNNVGWGFGDLEDVSGSITASGTVSSTAVKVRTAEGLVTSAGSLSGEAIRLRIPYGYVLASGNVNSSATATYDSKQNITATGSVTARAKYNVTVAGQIVGSGQVQASSYKIGEEWVDVSDESNVWTGSTVQTDTWTEITSGNNTWQ